MSYKRWSYASFSTFHLDSISYMVFGDDLCVDGLSVVQPNLKNLGASLVLFPVIRISTFGHQNSRKFYKNHFELHANELENIS